MKPDFKNFTEHQCIEFLKENFGLRGYNAKGITKEVKNRTLDNMRLECEIQYTILEHTGLSKEILLSL